MADGQVTRNTEIVKPNVRKVRTMIDGSVIGGFAGMSQVPSASPDITKASSSWHHSQNSWHCMHTYSLGCVLLQEQQLTPSLCLSG